MTKRPAVRRPRPWLFPTPQRASLPNGMRLAIFDRPGQYVVSAGLVIDLPLSAEPTDRDGVAHLTARCLDEGTQDHPGLSFVETLERQGAALGAHAGYSATQIGLDVPAGRLDHVLPLLAEAVTQPTLDDTDVDRLRELRLAEIEQARAHPAQRATLAFREAVIAPRFRAGRPTGGTTEGVTAVSGDDVRDFQRRHYTPQRSTLILAGDFASDPIEATFRAFGEWRAPEFEVDHERPQPAPISCLVVDRPGAVQADVRLGGFGVDRTDPRWPDLQMACYALGGAFLSRLNRILREERGFTYGVHLVNQPMRSGGLISLQGSFRTEVVADAVTEAADLLSVRGQPFTDQEIADAINFTVGVTPLRYASAEGIVEQVAALVAAGLSSDYLNSYLDALTRVTASSATEAISGVLDPERLNLVVVGDASVIVDPLRVRGWQVEVVADPD